jgi:radical SAM superfamily enzyme YgiQ (UPF0313 family)
VQRSGLRRTRRVSRKVDDGADDDLFLGTRRVIEQMMTAFTADRVGDRARWDATGRINVLHRASDATLDTLVDNGLWEIAFAIESGSQRMLTLIDKRIDPDMAQTVVRRLTERGINIRGYVIPGVATETAAEIDTTVGSVHQLWELTDGLPGRFRGSAFEHRPYPGTPNWHRLLATGRYTAQQLLNYSAVDLTDAGVDESMRERDEFNFSVNPQLSDASIDYVRSNLVALAREQYARKRCAE